MTSQTQIPPVIQAWHDLVDNPSLDVLNDLLADDAVFHSPVVHTPQTGKQITALYLMAAFQVLNAGGFTYVREVYGDSDAVLEFTTTLDGIHVNGIDLIHWNADGKIDDFKVMLRPLKAVNKVHQLMGAMLASDKNKK